MAAPGAGPRERGLHDGGGAGQQAHGGRGGARPAARPRRPGEASAWGVARETDGRRRVVFFSRERREELR
jgi:hypothetical protein